MKHSIFWTSLCRTYILNKHQAVSFHCNFYTCSITKNILYWIIGGCWGSLNLLSVWHLSASSLQVSRSPLKPVDFQLSIPTEPSEYILYGFCMMTSNAINPPIFYLSIWSIFRWNSNDTVMNSTFLSFSYILFPSQTIHISLTIKSIPLSY